MLLELYSLQEGIPYFTPSARGLQENGLRTAEGPLQSSTVPRTILSRIQSRTPAPAPVSADFQAFCWKPKYPLRLCCPLKPSREGGWVAQIYASQLLVSVVEH